MQIQQVKNFIYYILFLSIAAGFLYFSFRDIKLIDFLDQLKQANYFYIGLSVIIGMMAYVFRTLRWRLLIEPLGFKVRFMETYHAMMIGYAANLVVPRLGEVTRCVTLNRTSKTPLETLFGTVVAERIIDLLCLVVAIVLVFFLRIDVFGVFLLDHMLQPLWISCQKLLSTINLMYASVAGICIVFAVFMAFKYMQKNRFFSPLWKLLKGMGDGLKSVFKLHNVWLFLAYTLGIWLCFLFTSYTVILALPSTASLDLVDAMFLMVIGALAWVVPVPGGIGAFHYFVPMALGVYGIAAKPDGLVFATIAHETQIIPMALLGIISLIAFTLFKRKEKHNS